MIDWMKIVAGKPEEKRAERWKAAEALGDHLYTYRCRGKDAVVPGGLRDLSRSGEDRTLLAEIANHTRAFSEWRTHVTWLEGENARSLLIIWDHLIFLRELVGHLVKESQDPVISAEKVREVLDWADRAERLETKIRTFLEREYPEGASIPGADLRLEARARTRRYDLCPTCWRELDLSGVSS